ncbi:integral membrane protein [Streptomyces laurentii]|uniref:Integral membrane protein n=1 Tax=Streptomyces laurentii TaxID=39478 RepID=A0A169NNI1_STRLU|nr:integral membrane protein [Streptomyces laurentii]
MSRRFRPRTAQVPAGATTVHIPQQRGSRSAGPVVVLVSEPPRSLSSRATRALGRLAWHYRAAWAPTGFALLAYPLVAVVHVVGPWAAWVLAAATLAPPVGVWWRVRKHADRLGERPGRLLTLAGLVTAALGWAAATVHFGPLTAPLAWLWLGLTLAAQSFWLVIRRSK